MSLLSPLRHPFRYSFFNATLLLIVLNLSVYFLNFVWPNSQVFLALNPLLALEGKMFWQPVTYMFVHGGFNHLFFNMLGLLFFGLAVERAIGSKEFLLMYFVTGILCGIFYGAVYFFLGHYKVFLMGASGAIYGLLLAYAVIFPKSKIFIWGIIPVPAPLLVCLYGAIEFFSQFTAFDGVAHLAHVSGLVFTWLYFVIRMGVHPLRVWKDAYRR